MLLTARTLLATSTLLLLASCGSGEDTVSDAAPAEEGSSSAAPTESPSAPDTSQAEIDAEIDAVVGEVQGEATTVGLDVAGYAIDQGFVNPKDQADFEANVDYAKSLRPGSEAGYEVMGDTFRICVTRFDGDEPVAWAIYDGKSGISAGEAGAPTEPFCP